MSADHHRFGTGGSGEDIVTASDVPDRQSVIDRLRAVGCVFAEEEADLVLEASTTPDDVQTMIDQRSAGVPLEQILGWAELSGLRIRVAPGVFVPRRRTELLVEEAVRRLSPGVCVVDLCCGSGAVAAALSRRVEDLELYAADVDPVAVSCAETNLVGRAQVLTGDLYAALPPTLRGRIAVITANAPYVPTDAIALMPSEARDHEPRVALDGGSDGLDLHRRIAAEAAHWLAPGGHVLIETSRRQSPTTASLLEDSGLTVEVIRSDDLDATVVVGGARVYAVKSSGA